MVEQSIEMRKREDLVFPNAAGIAVGASSHWAAVPAHRTDAPLREFGAMTDDLNELTDWLIACVVDMVAPESTEVYWISVYKVQEDRGLKVWMVDARQAKYVTGSMSDLQNCQWLQRLMS
jgi:predicted molibdopterin-dependent oxidoreductase YjgC